MQLLNWIDCLDDDRGCEHNRVCKALLQGIMLSFYPPARLRHAVHMGPPVLGKLVSLQVFFKDVSKVGHLAKQDSTTK